MKFNEIVLSLASVLLLWACENPQASSHAELSTITTEQIDTINAIKISGFWTVPKESFEFNSLGSSIDDTLTIVTCGEYVFSPFGEINNKSQLRESLLKNFTVIDRVDTMSDGAFQFQILKLKDSRLITFFDDDPEASRRSYVFKGEINDNDINLAEGVKMGMSKEDFINTFFERFPTELLNKYNHIVFESCVTDIWHTYTFSKDRLKSVKFKTDSYWTVNYEK